MSEHGAGGGAGMAAGQNERVGVFAVVGPDCAASVACMLARVAAGRRGGIQREVLLVDAEGYISGELARQLGKSAARADSGSSPVIGAGAGLALLPYPGGEARCEPGFVEYLRREYECVFVACGGSAYAGDLLSGSGRVVVCGASEAQMLEAASGAERYSGPDGIVAAALGEARIPEALAGRGAYRLPAVPGEGCVRFDEGGSLSPAGGDLAEGALDGLVEALFAGSDGGPEERREGDGEDAVTYSATPMQVIDDLLSYQRQPERAAGADSRQAARPAQPSTTARESESAAEDTAAPRDAGEAGAGDAGVRGDVGRAQSRGHTPGAASTGVDRGADVAGAPERPPGDGGDGGDGGSGSAQRRPHEPPRGTTHSQPHTEGEKLSKPTSRNNNSAGPLAALKSGIAAAISRGRARTGGRGPAGGAPERAIGPVGAGEAVEPESDADLERRLTLSLRETTIGGVAKFCVGSPKGGVGKSSLAYAFAGAIAHYTNLRVCLVDADPNFGSMRLLVPRPTARSVVDMAADADGLTGLSQIRDYVSKNEKMGLDVVLGPVHAYELAEVENLGEAYARVDSVLSRFYDLVVYDLGPGFRDPAIREVLTFSDELLYVTDAEKVSNTMVSDAVEYVESLGVGLSRHSIMLTIQHRLAGGDESAKVQAIRESHSKLIDGDRITEIPYDGEMSKLLNNRSFNVEDLSARTRLSVMTTAATCLDGLRRSRFGKEQSAPGRQGVSGGAGGSPHAGQ